MHYTMVEISSENDKFQTSRRIMYLSRAAVVRVLTSRESFKLTVLSYVAMVAMEHKHGYVRSADCITITHIADTGMILCCLLMQSHRLM